MSFRSSSLITLGILVLLVAFVLVPQSSAQIPDFEVRVDHTTAYPGTNNAEITVSLTNRADTISGFNIWIQLSRPDIMIFQQDTATIYDTTYWKCLSYFGDQCVDSQMVIDPLEADTFYVETYLDTIGNVDTTGCRTAGWELIDSRSLSGTGTDINVVGIADLPGGPGRTAGIPPEFSGGPLFKILADVYHIPDTLQDRVVELIVQTDFKDHFSFSDPTGSTLGYIQQEYEDTSCFHCTEWIGDECFNYVQVTFGECDSIEVVLDTMLVLDTANVKIFNGSLTVLPGSVCGNLDGVVDPVIEIDISDLVYFVDWLFNEGPAPDPLYIANLNCDVENGDIGDLVMMVDYMFNEGEPICECWGN